MNPLHLGKALRNLLCFCLSLVKIFCFCPVVDDMLLSLLIGHLVFLVFIALSKIFWLFLIPKLQEFKSLSDKRKKTQAKNTCMSVAWRRKTTARSVNFVFCFASTISVDYLLVKYIFRFTSFCRDLKICSFCLIFPLI